MEKGSFVVYKVSVLDPLTKRKLVEHCAKELNFLRYGTHTPYYLWAASNRREVEGVLKAAEEFMTVNPPSSTKAPLS